MTQFIYFWEMVHTQYSHRIGIYRLDNGQEYMNQHVETFYKEKGALLEFTAPYTPAQNGVSERTMGLVATMARSTRIAAALPAYLWDELTRTAIQILNMAPTTALSEKTPASILEDALGKSPSTAVPTYDRIRTMGQTAYVHIPGPL